MGPIHVRNSSAPLGESVLTRFDTTESALGKPYLYRIREELPVIRPEFIGVAEKPSNLQMQTTCITIDIDSDILPMSGGGRFGRSSPSNAPSPTCGHYLRGGFPVYRIGSLLHRCHSSTERSTPLYLARNLERTVRSRTAGSIPNGCGSEHDFINTFAWIARRRRALENKDGDQRILRRVVRRWKKRDGEHQLGTCDKARRLFRRYCLPSVVFGVDRHLCH